MKARISAAIITRDEEKNLPHCVKSLSFADEIVVVDSGSTDRTVETAKNLGCRVFIENWKGYGPQKNSAIKKCKNEWVIVLDADESIPEDTRKKIIEFIEKPGYYSALGFRRKNFLHNRWIRSCGWWPDRQARVLKKDSGSYDSIVHEKWVFNDPLAKVKEIDEVIEHRPFDSYHEMLIKLNDYSKLNAIKLFEKNKRASILDPFTHGISMFFKSYILKKGFLDGMDGFIIALTAGGGSFFKYAKLLELQRTKGKKDI